MVTITVAVVEVEYCGGLVLVAKVAFLMKITFENNSPKNNVTCEIIIKY